MKKLLHNTVSVALAFLVLLSTFSFTIGKHYCMDEVVAVSWLGQADDCGMETPTDSNDDSEQLSFKKPCCNDTLEVVKSSNEELKSTSEISLEIAKFLAVFFVSHNALLSEELLKEVSYLHYNPPPRIQDYTILFDTFLI